MSNTGDLRRKDGRIWVIDGGDLHFASDLGLIRFLESRAGNGDTFEFDLVTVDDCDLLVEDNGNEK